MYMIYQPHVVLEIRFSDDDYGGVVISIQVLQSTAVYTYENN